MRKFLKKVFSPRTLIIIVVLLEFAVMAALWWFLENGLDMIIDAQGKDVDVNVTLWAALIWLAIRLALSVIAIIVFFRIVNRDENPEYKIPWLAFLFIFPFITLSFYAIFVRTKLNRRESKILRPVQAQLKEKKHQLYYEHHGVLDEIEPQYQGVFTYLHKTTQLTVSKNNRLTYYKNGEQFFPEFVEDLKKAEKFIFIEFFIVSEGIWWDKVHEVLKQKAAEGVEVRFLYDDIGSSPTLPNNFLNKMRKEGIKCSVFHPLSIRISTTLNNRDHRKIVVIDHKIAYTGGMNLADEYANDKLRFGYWKDTMVRIEGKGIRDLIAIYLENYDLASDCISDYSAYLDGEDYPVFDDKGYCFSFGDGAGPYTGFEQIGEQNYINLLNVATKQVDISTPYLICSYPLLRAVQAAARRGVRVNLIVPGIPDKKMVYKMAQCQFNLFLDAGVHIYTYTPGFNHEKQMLVDDRICFCGTVNFDFRSLTHHFEDGMVFLDTPCIPEVRADFDEMIAQSKEVPKDYKAPSGQMFVSGLLKIFRVLL